MVTLCQDVIASGQYSLAPTFPDIWKDGLNGAGKNGPESIFEMQAISAKMVHLTTACNGAHLSK